MALRFESRRRDIVRVLQSYNAGGIRASTAVSGGLTASKIDKSIKMIENILMLECADQSSSILRNPLVPNQCYMKFPFLCVSPTAK